MLSKTDIEKYFLAEKQIGFYFFIIGVIAIVLAMVCLLVLRSGFYKGIAVPLIVLGLLELFAGYAVYSKSDKDRIRNVYAFDMDPQQLREVELPRLQKVNDRFTILKIVELVLIVGSIVMLLYFRTQPEKVFWQGCFMALGVQAIILLAADFSASVRARNYQQKLEAFVQKHP